MEEFKELFFNPLLWAMAILLLAMSNYGPFAIGL